MYKIIGMELLKECGVRNAEEVKARIDAAVDAYHQAKDVYAEDYDWEKVTWIITVTKYSSDDADLRADPCMARYVPVKWEGGDVIEVICADQEGEVSSLVRDWDGTITHWM